LITVTWAVLPVVLVVKLDPLTKALLEKALTVVPTVALKIICAVSPALMVQPSAQTSVSPEEVGLLVVKPELVPVTKLNEAGRISCTLVMVPAALPLLTI